MIFRRPTDAERAATEDDLAAREDPYHVTQASRIYLLPNSMTAGNLCCGFVAIIFCIKASYEMRLAGVKVAADLTPESISYFKWAVWLIMHMSSGRFLGMVVSITFGLGESCQGCKRDLRAQGKYWNGLQ